MRLIKKPKNCNLAEADYIFMLNVIAK